MLSLDGFLRFAFYYYHQVPRVRRKLDVLRRRYAAGSIDRAQVLLEVRCALPNGHLKKVARHALNYNSITYWNVKHEMHKRLAARLDDPARSAAAVGLLALGKETILRG